MRAFANLIALIAAFVAATLFAGWWAVPALSLCWTLAFPRRAAVIYASFAAVTAWGALLAWAARTGPIARVDVVAGAVMQLPAHALMGLTLFYAALLAGASALLAQAIRPPRPPRRPAASTVSSPSR
jgi:hypothetical protein